MAPLETGVVAKTVPCPVCREDMMPGAPLVGCSVCETQMHAECGEYVGGCVRFACVEAATPRKRVVHYLDLKLRSQSMMNLFGTSLMFAIFMTTTGPLLSIQKLGTMALGLLSLAQAFAGYLARRQLDQPAIPGRDLRALLAATLTPKNEISTEKAWLWDSWWPSAFMFFMALVALMAGDRTGGAVGHVVAGLCLLLNRHLRKNARDLGNQAERLGKVWKTELDAVAASAADELVLLESPAEAGKAKAGKPGAQ